MISIEDVFNSLKGLELHGFIFEKRPLGYNPPREQLVMQVPLRVRLTIGTSFPKGQIKKTEFIESDIDYFLGDLKIQIECKYTAVTQDEFILIEETLRNLFKNKDMID